MGGSHWDDDFYNDRVSHRAATNTPTFVHTAAVKSGTAKAGVHDRLNVFGKIRESRDSDAHPDSVAIGVVLDHTGSMGEVPPIVQAALPKLMGLLLRKGYIKDPQILMGCVGDYFADKASLQLGQFESGVEMDDDITHFLIEKGGGGQNTESYQNAMYYFAHRTSIDCFEKRGKKGYLFLIGDESPFAQSREEELLTLMGREATCPGGMKHMIEGGATKDQIAAAVKEKYEVFFIIPKGTSNYSQPWLKEEWSRLLGPERVIFLEDPAAICETIGSVIGLCEGTADADSYAANLKDIGSSSAIANVVTTSLDTLAKSTALARVGTGSLPEKTGRSDAIERL